MAVDFAGMIATAEKAVGSEVEAQHLALGQVLLRAVIVFFAALVIVRVADKRFLAKKTAFDVILGFILGSMLARAINGSEQLTPTIAAGFALALLHRFLGWVGCHWPAFAGFIKGHAQKLIENGVVDRRCLERHHIGKDDLIEELRLNGVNHPEEVKLAYLERSGEVSVVKKE
jgi:uncharacterized membrane protein YcaP (DUF421 family)